MATIFNTLKKPNGDPIRGALVQVSLSWDSSADAVVRDESNEVVFDNTASVKTDVDGYWEMEVPSNDSLNPVSYYKIIETVSATNINTYYIDVTTAATPVFWILDILVSTPAWES